MIMTVLACALLYLLITTRSNFFDKSIEVEHDGKKFKVLDLPDKNQAAKILSSIDLDIVKLKTHMAEKYKSSDDSLLKQIGRRAADYNSNSLKENYPDRPKKDVSYNLNKGETIAICLRNYKNPELFHAYNEILFVSLHELAHSLNCNESSFMCGNTYGHDDTFWYIFKVILQDAVDIGIYSKKNYRSNPVNYCSMNITYSPLYDQTI